MSKAWIRAKTPEFVRDVLRDFCLASQDLERIILGFEQTGDLAFGEIRELLGVEMNKGLLWRLKDTAHHLFRNKASPAATDLYLDWALGYVFHETLKLKEDAYQQQTYGPRFRAFLERDLSDAERAVGLDLYQVVDQTRESIARETRRIRFILTHCRALLPVYLADHAENQLLARFLFESESLVRHVFGDGFEPMLQAIYGEQLERLYILASRSLRQGGWIEDATNALERAFSSGGENPLVLQEKEIVDNWKRKLRV